MKDIFKKGLLFALIYFASFLVVSAIVYFLKMFFGDDTPFVIPFGVVTIVINIFGIFLSPILLPVEICHPSGFMGCESLTGEILTVFLNMIFYFALGVFFGFLYSRKKYVNGR